MSGQDKTSDAVHEAERARLDDGLSAMGFPSSGGRRGGGFRLAAAVRDARSDRGFDFGEEWQRQRAAREQAAEARAAARQTPHLRLAPPADPPPGDGADPVGTAIAAPSRPALPAPAPAEDGMGVLLGYLERRDERIFGLIERLALGPQAAAPAPPPPPPAEPADPHAAFGDRLARIEAALAALVPAAAPTDDPAADPHTDRGADRGADPDTRPVAGDD
jgi:hypothetical protein